MGSFSVAEGPYAVSSAGGESLHELVVVEAPHLPVDPAVGDGLLHRLLVSDTLFSGRLLLNDYPEDSLIRVILLEPAAPLLS